ncbi:PREDICTED: filaggrin-like [Condylura cristata]|uniref:filaggrin-like n=1 Tax=Condylura cristata TaxID=143302 RepID=UPI000643A37B|nr:PREDICTED: filaggrin-like [Condylura cristata]
MPTLLENIIAIIDLFHQYSKTDQETETLSKTELTELLQTEFHPILKHPDDPETAEVFMQILDIDHNKQIDFTEFFLMLFRLAQAYYASNRRKNIQASGGKYRHHHKNEEDDTEEEIQEEENDKHNRKSSLSRSKGKGKKARSKSPNIKGKKDHSSSEGGKRDKSTCRHKHGFEEQLHDLCGKKKGKSSSSEVQERRHKTSISPTKRNTEYEDELDYGQTSSRSSKNRHRESSTSQTSNSKGHLEDSGRQSSMTHGKSRSSSRNQLKSTHGHSEDTSKYSMSHQGQTAPHCQPDSAHRQSGSSTKERQGHDHGDTSRHSETEHGPISSGPRKSKHEGSIISQFSDNEGQSKHLHSQLE